MVDLNFDEFGILLKIQVLNDFVGIMAYWETRMHQDPDNPKLKEIAERHIEIVQQTEEFIHRLWDKSEIANKHSSEQSKIAMEQMLEVKKLKEKIKEMNKHWHEDE